MEQRLSPQGRITCPHCGHVSVETMPWAVDLKYFTTLLLIAVSALPSLAQTAPEVFGLPAGQHSVGFRLLQGQDAARVVTGSVRGAVHPRPIRTYFWYPAETARASPMRFGGYAALADDDVWPEEIAGELRERLKFANGPLARSPARFR